MRRARERRSIILLLLGLAVALAGIAPAGAGAATPSSLDLTVENKLGTSWSFDQDPVQAGAWEGALPGLIPSQGSVTFSAVPTPQGRFAGTAVYMLDEAGKVTVAAIHVTVLGSLQSVRCLPPEGGEAVPDCTYRREGQDFFVGLYEPLSGPPPQAELTFEPTVDAADLLSGGLPLGLEATKPGQATVSLSSGGRVAAQAKLPSVRPAFSHHVRLRLRPWSRRALRQGELGRLALRVRLADTTGHARTYRRAVHVTS